MTNIAFIGLGIMGSPMAVHLAKAGHQVAGFNRSPEKTNVLIPKLRGSIPSFKAVSAKCRT